MNTAPQSRSRHVTFRTLLIPLSGLIALLWVLVRVVPKPSRAQYPCQRVAAPLASGFLGWLAATVFGVIPSVAGVRLASRKWRTGRVPALVMLTLAAAAFAVVFAVGDTGINIAQDDPPFIPEASNQPIGTGRGIHPGRVVWVHDPDATTGDLEGNWWDDRNTDPVVVDRMIADTVTRLTGEPTIRDSWNALFNSFNRTHGTGERGYRTGEKIAIKVNMNNSDSGEWGADTYNTSPQVIDAVIRQLIGEAGVHGEDITIYDASRGIGDPVIERIRSNPGEGYRQVRFVVSPDRMGPGRIPATYDTAHPMCFADTTMEDYNRTYLPACVVDAEYHINIGILKGHNLAGVTLCAKNFMGSLYRPTIAESGTSGWTPNGTDERNRGLHGFVNPFYYAGWELPGRPKGSYNALVDLMGHEHLGGKVMLFIVDGLYSAKWQNRNDEGYHGLSIVKWRSAPFNNDWPSSIFASQDFVALESVCVDFMCNEPEMEWIRGSLDNYLHEAALADNPPSGTFYDPEGDGTRLASLGVHEHWNNAADRQYSRNLGSDRGIELVQIPQSR